MIFKDRRDAGRQLANLLKHELEDINSKDTVVMSLLRGGILVGYEVAKELHSAHLPLVVSKISAPDNEELAIGAVCFDITYLDREIINYLGGLPRNVLRAMIEDAQYKFNNYMERFMLRTFDYSMVKNKTVIVVDDGIATGASVKAACLYLSTLRPKNILSAAPVVLGNIQIPGIPIISNIPNGATGSISQYYESFHQLEDDEILKLLRFS